MAGILERLTETKAAMELTTLALKGPAPSSSLAAVQPQLVQVVVRNRQFLSSSPEGTPEQREWLTRNTDLLEMIARTDSTSVKSLNEWLEAARRTAQGAVESGAGVAVAVVVGLAVIFLIILVKR